MSGLSTLVERPQNERVWVGARGFLWKGLCSTFLRRLWGGSSRRTGYRWRGCHAVSGRDRDVLVWRARRESQDGVVSPSSRIANVKAADTESEPVLRR